MAMKLGSYKLKLFSVAVLLLAGCASGPKKQEISLAVEKNISAEMINANQFIPTRTIDEETGLLVPYLPMPNPYTQLKGRVSSKSVNAFITARRAFQNGESQKAKSLLEQLVIDDQSLSGPWVILGDIAKLNKMPEESISHYAKAIAINKHNVNAYIRLAKLQREQGQFLRAQNTYVKALSVWKDFPEAHLNLAVLYDLYLNKSLLAQRHLEAYQFLTNGENKKTAQWLSEIQQRTGKALTLNVESKKASSLEPS